jgi:hypothetical protein
MQHLSPILPDVASIISNVQRRVGFILFGPISTSCLFYDDRSFDTHLGLDYHQSFDYHCHPSNRWICFVSVRTSIAMGNSYVASTELFRRAKFEAELKAMQWLIKWEELTTRTLLNNGVATPSFNKLSTSQKVIRRTIIDPFT